MQWSQLKKQLKTRIADGLAGSLDVHQTRYRHAHDQEGEFWMTFDRDRIFSAGSLSYLSALGKMTAQSMREGATPAQAYTKAWPAMEASGLMLLEEINRDLFRSLGQTVEAMLESRNPVIRGLAIADTRYGKRRLSAFDAAGEHPLVQRLFQLRCDAEGLRPCASFAPAR